MKKLISYIYVFAILGLQMLGNIGNLVPLLERELVDKRHLVSKEDVLNSIALGRCGPGVTVINAIIFLGNKIMGFWGGIISSISFIIFPFIIIVIISTYIDSFMQNVMIISAFKGISVSLCVIIIKSIINLIKSNITDKITVIVFIGTLFMLIFTEVPVFIYIIISIIIGLGYQFISNNWLKML